MLLYYTRFLNGIVGSEDFSTIGPVRRLLVLVVLLGFLRWLYLALTDESPGPAQIAQFTGGEACPSRTTKGVDLWLLLFMGASVTGVLPEVDPSRWPDSVHGALSSEEAKARQISVDSHGKTTNDDDAVPDEEFGVGLGTLPAVSTRLSRADDAHPEPRTKERCVSFEIKLLGSVLFLDAAEFSKDALNGGFKHVTPAL